MASVASTPLYKLMRLPRPLAFVAAVALVLGICWLDYWTGRELSISPLYLLPVAYVAWSLGRGPGLGVAVLCAISWYAAETASGFVYHSPLVPFWNASMRLTYFAMTAFFLSALHDHIREQERHVREQEQLIDQLRNALAQIKTLSGLLPICAWCRKVRDDEGYWQQIEEYVTAHSDAAFTHGICPKCYKDVQSRIK
ncbi:MAG: DUF4118 domain-containing protein [Bdellovibrionales bacterium]|nr:DUF4118 domain-containing protein [Bdellovibrionales bacterium]